MVRLLILLFLATGPAFAQGAWPPEVKLSVIPDAMPDEPFVGEMVLATLRGEYRGNVALEHLLIPPFEDFSWLQLAAPDWSEERIDNRPVKVFEQRLAFFPRRPGALTIGPITHELTFAGEAQRLKLTATSAPVVIETKARPDTGRAWWLPARNLTVTDVWDPEPNRLAPDQWTHRSVTIEATGLPAEALPPAPPMAAGGLFSFIDPEERSVRLTPDGPVATVTWHYRMQPQSDAPADLDDIPIAWFDTGARIRREVTLEGREISFAASALPSEPGPLARNAITVGAASGAILGLVLLLPGLGTARGPLPARLRRWALSTWLGLRLYRAERGGDMGRARATLLDLLRLNGLDPARSTTLATLDRRIFGPGGQSAPSGIARMARMEIRGDPA